MAYEYEKVNIRKLKSYNVLSGGANITKPIDELKEVYRKAKAFDEIMKGELGAYYDKAKAWDNYLLSVEEDAKNEFGDNEDLVKHAVELNKKIFMEDE
jgi:hypothetical protein